jgi:glucose-1-phosphate thymidylyltransferase
MIKGVILSGGLGTRMGMFTRRCGNKHVIPVYNRPMIEFPLSTFSQAGIKDIAIVTSNHHAGDLAKLIGDGKEFGFDSVSYFVQVGETGIAGALRLVRPFTGKDKFAVILGDNFYEMDIEEELESYDKSLSGAKVFLKEVEDPQRFGIAELARNMIISIEEKPKTPKSNKAITGLYLFDHQALDFADSVSPSARNELEITSVLGHYMQRGQLSWAEVKGYWSDMGQIESMDKTSRWIKDNHKALVDSGRFSQYKFKLQDGTYGDYINEIM